MKVFGPKRITQFRPISVCTVLFKIITKTMVNRLQLLMGILPVLTRTFKVKRFGMAIKIDLEKAYDRIWWDFLEDNLMEAGLPYFLARFIIHYVSCFSLQVLRNESIEQWRWKPFRLSKIGSILTHLFFANDLFLFGEADRGKLNGCDANKLSLAGRITLANNVLLAIPNYFMDTIVMPISICREIEKLAQNFIWGSNLLDRKPTLMDWEDCCHPVERRGLGLWNLVYQNKVFLLKLGYQLLTDTEAFWVQVSWKKYRIDGMLPTSISRTNYSFIWRSVSKFWPEVLNKVFWSIGDGSTVNF
ncbi:hypothetical protein J1N35_044056 [Gossypium stocksii]|uniref:Reverse transcriptase domain-containing protein n=1 Tax=Gossypium stocksii TaxID=47602 RepID=A0A9D3ZFS3_9ROSI|nr:hypothetical protein J1N35_044056 [Gossypium stocksii]